jgi:hypothetical protein
MDANEYLFSAAALEILNRQQYDPTAKGSYELLSGGLRWPDEFPKHGEPGWGEVFAPWAFRFLLAARAAITLGDEQTGFRSTWDQVVREAPNWPGLRPDRRGEQARKRLLAAKRREANCLDELERQLNEQQGG